MASAKSYLLFTLNSESFGIEVEFVLRVIDLEGLMKVPKAPDFISGALNMEGTVIPVVDLAKKIDLGVTEVNDKTKVVILQILHEDETLDVGVLIDNVKDVVNITDKELQAPPLENMGFDTQTLDGMYKLEENFYMILSAKKVFEKELMQMV